jgi:hypothetical protein
MKPAAQLRPAHQLSNITHCLLNGAQNDSAQHQANANRQHWPSRVKDGLRASE